ncbi:hypothetical protein HETIRDRAFT_446249 [Heterobasidion irregulare TC 32-1]|uniref:Phosphatidate cytidylyltransferase n=1 Tax=Heterobasidion irregulare (strain TC 32-1) TaxID=747525 RepID=W4JUI8_HETIT|nr:uncharacterized protein HETIRDRAFT_446249 [Heterobasidion irregulare TC 32-1]ETW77212.1 hypothetical protein HETIRDRAFT_446249 [Heterobasidion irregulare TC 32-1]
MTLPANDAFSLALAHSSDSSSSHSHSVPRRRSLTRSPSPKITFSAPSGQVRRRIPKRSASGNLSTGAPDGGARLEEVEEMQEVERGLLGNGTLKPSDEDVKMKQSARKENADKVDWEIPRKALHSSIGFLTLYLYTSNGTPQPVVLALAGALLVIVPADMLRLNSPAFARVYERFLGFLMRESEKKTTNGVIWYIVGVLFVLTLYPLDIATISILILSWADTAASTFGRLWGRHTPPLPAHILGLPLAPRKSLAGFLAAALTGAGICAAFYAHLGSDAVRAGASWDFVRGVAAQGVDGSAVGGAVRAWLRERAGFEGVAVGGWAGLAMISIVTGVVAALAEALDLGSADDNLTLPIISGGCIWGFLKALSWFSS